MRRALLAAATAALLFAIYAAAGYWLAPRLVRDTLVSQADKRGLELRLVDVRTDPFALAVELDGIELVRPDGGTLAAAAGAKADLAWASLWRSRWIVQELTFHRPEVQVALAGDGSLNWAVATTTQEDATTQAAGDPQEKTAQFVVERLALTEGSVHFVDRSRAAPVESRLESLELRLDGLTTQAGQPARYELAARVADAGSVSSQGSVSLQPFAARGSLSIEGVSAERVWHLAAPGTDAAQGRLQAESSWTFDGTRLGLEDVSVAVADFSYFGLELDELALRSPAIDVPLREPFEISASARAKAGGNAAAEGTIALAPFTTELQLEVSDFMLPQAQRWLPENVAIDIVSGSLSARGRLRFQEQLGFEGSASVSDARVDEAGSDRPLLAWQRLETDDAKLRLSPFAAEIGELTARAPSARLIIGPDGKLNFADVFPTSEDDTAEKTSFEATVARLTIENGTLDFADRSLENEFAVTVRELSGVVAGIGTAMDDPARVQLEGRVEQYGSARIGGTVDLDQPTSLTDVGATLRNIPLAALTPYIVKFAGYRVKSGRVSAELRYRVHEGRLVGDNDLVFEQLQLGEKVRGAGAPDLPLELAVALLADSKGRIDIDIPVSGDLSDPQVDLGGLIAKAIGNVVVRIVSAPFRALGALFGDRTEDPGSLRFEPGSVALTPPLEQNVAQVAKALAERPRLGVEVRGGYDPQRDVAALRTNAVRRQIAERAGYEAGSLAVGLLDFSDPRILRAAEDLYREQVGNRVQMLEMRERSPRYGLALVQALAAATPVEPGTAEKLARARAETVRAALLANGVEASRVRLGETVSVDATDDGVPTGLALGLNRP